MRIFTVSDLHIDYKENKHWLYHLSRYDYTDDILILPGDVSDRISVLEKTFMWLKTLFREVLFIPGNHDLWVLRNRNVKDSLEKLSLIETICNDHGILMKPLHVGSVSIVPLYGWYDFSFGEPSSELMNSWFDFRACRWPEGFTEKTITDFFLAKNTPYLNITNKRIISFSHFLPRIDIMPSFIPPDKRILYPALGTSHLDTQIHTLGSHIHIYGHSHLNRKVSIDGTIYLNNAYGYPDETLITAKRLISIYDGLNPTPL